MIQCWIHSLEHGDTVLDTQVRTRCYSAGYTGWNTMIQCYTQVGTTPGDTVPIIRLEYGDTVLDTQVGT